ncbi:MAG: hypothetical protein U0798_20045, partial [Gemmataceae bacterium]
HETKRVENICVFDNGKKLVVACDTVTLWDLTKGVEIRTFQGHPGAICVGVSPNGKFMATGWYDGIMKLWSIDTGDMLAEFQAHEANCDWLSFSPDGLSLLSAGGGKFEDGKGVKGSDHVARIWKIDELTPKKIKVKN